MPDTIRAAMVLALLAIAGTTGRANEPPPGAAMCSGCHAVNAAAETPVPPIAGRKTDETVAQMAGYRSGALPGTIMGRIAKGFTEDETRAIAQWLETQR